MVSRDTILKWEMFVWIFSHVPSAIALSLFILKSSNLDKIKDSSYQNLSCGNVRLLVAYKLKLVLVPCATSEWPKVPRSFWTVYYVHYALPTCRLPIFFKFFFCNSAQNEVAMYILSNPYSTPSEVALCCGFQ